MGSTPTTGSVNHVVVAEWTWPPSSKRKFARSIRADDTAASPSGSGRLPPKEKAVGSNPTAVTGLGYRNYAPSPYMPLG